jgi:competence protein ComEC
VRPAVCTGRGVTHLSSFLTAALVAGVAGGVGVDTPVTLVLAVVMSAAWATALLAYLRGFVRAQLAAVCMLVAGAGWVLGAHAVAHALHPPLGAALERWDDDEPVIVEGRLREDAAVTASGAVMRIDVERVAIGGVMRPVAGGISVGVGGGMQPRFLAQWTAGRLLRTPALLRRPARYLNVGVPDQERALARRGIALVGTIKSAALVEILERGSWWQETAAAVRARTRHALTRHVASQGELSAAIATAILVGDRAALSSDLERRLQEAGTYHVIAISGGNIAILAALCLGGLRAVGFHGRLASVIAICTLSAYASIAMGGASVLRATLMAVIYLAMRAIDHRTAAANAISLTAALVLLMTPLAIGDVGFWLTFGATIALLAAGTKASKASKASKRNAKGTKGTNGTNGTKGMDGTKGTTGARSTTGTTKMSDSSGGGRVVAVMVRGAVTASGPLMARVTAALSMVLVGTICVELALAPIAAYVFQRVTIAGLLLNFVAIPAMTIVQVGAMAVVACDLVGLPRLAGWLGSVVHVASMALSESARLVDYAPWLTWRTLPPQPLVMAAYYAALVAAFLSFRESWPSWLRRSAAVAAAALLLWMVASPAARVRARGDDRLHLTLLDVGQGDSMLVTFPNGRTLVVDTGASSPGGEFDIGDRVVGPALRARGLLALDYLAVTHPDPDHVGGARSVVHDFAINEVWWGVPVANHEPTASVRALAEQRRIGWRTLQRGDRLDVGDVEVRVHHPPPPDWERQRVRNNDSLVIELRFGDVSMLLTGDIGREVENELAAALDPLPVSVVKVAHHGSATSTGQPLLDRIRPDVALIGVGRGNPYGHPVPHVLGRLHDVGAEVFRTDLDGQIELVTDGRRVEVRTFTGRTHRVGKERHE